MIPYSTLAVGDQVWFDRNYEFTNIGQYGGDCYYLKGSNDDKNTPETSVQWTLDVSFDCTVYLDFYGGQAHVDRGFPTDGWSVSSRIATEFSNHGPGIVYERSFSSGTIDLYGNSGDGHGTYYAFVCPFQHKILWDTPITPMNCFENFGAELNIDNDPITGVTSVNDCKLLCETHSTCNCIAYFNNQCWRRKNCDISECTTNMDVTTVTGTRITPSVSYIKLEDGESCDVGRITDESTCIQAADALGYVYSNSWHHAGDVVGCIHANDGRNKFYFNTALDANGHNPRYAEVCEVYGNYYLGPIDTHCGDADYHVLDIDECIHALGVLGEDQHIYWGQDPIKSSGGIPRGCSVKVVDSGNRGHFNSHHTGGSREDIRPVCRSLTDDGTGADVNLDYIDYGDFSSQATMIANGWVFNNPLYNNAFISVDRNARATFCQGVPDEGYCGFSYPGVGTLSLTIPAAGTVDVTFGNSHGGVNQKTVLSVNNIELGNAVGFSSTSLVFDVNAGDVLTFSDHGETVMSIHSFTLTMCHTMGNEAIQRENVDAVNQYSFLDPSLEFETSGKVTQWIYYAARDAKIYLQVYRGDDISFTLICTNEIDPQGTGLITYDVPEDEQCLVERGDVIGWYVGSEGVLSYDDGGQTIRWQESSGQDYVVGDTMEFQSGSVARTYSVSAKMCPVSRLNWRCDDGKCYTIAHAPMTFEKAVTFCENYDATLVKIQSAEENAFVSDVCGSHSCWIGLSEAYDTEDWFWQDGTALEYNNWHGVEPNNYNGFDETVAFMNLVHPHFTTVIDGTWFDGRSQDSYQYPFCERDAGAVECSLTLDNVLTHIRYNGVDLSFEGDRVNWVEPKTFSFTPIPGHILEIGGYESVTCDGCACSGLLLECSNGFTSNLDWVAAGSESILISPETGYDSVCQSTSTFSLAGQTSNAIKIWPNNGQKYAWFKVVPLPWADDVCYVDNTYTSAVSEECHSDPPTDFIQGTWNRMPADWPSDVCNDDTCVNRCREDGIAFNSDYGESHGVGETVQCARKNLCRPCRDGDPGCVYPGDATEDWCNQRCPDGVYENLCPHSHCFCDIDGWGEEQQIVFVAYWEVGSCGPYGNDANWEVCGKQDRDCPDMIDYNGCPSGQAELYSFSSGHTDENGCRYAYFAEYVCSEPEYVLIAYWDREKCGPEDSERNWDVCDQKNGNCPDFIEHVDCPSGYASLYRQRNSINIEGCQYGYIAEYICTPDPEEIVLTAFWDAGTCGPGDDDENWEVCGKQDGICPILIEFDDCPYGKAIKFAYERQYTLDGCYFPWFAQYMCTESENPCFTVVEKEACMYSQYHYIGANGERWDVADIDYCKTVCLNDEYCAGFNYVHTGVHSGGHELIGTGACYYRKGYPDYSHFDENRTCYIRDRKCGGNLGEANYCSCWGDPHCTTFEDGQKTPAPLSFHHFEAGDFRLIQVGHWEVIQTQKKMGWVSIITGLRVEYDPGTGPVTVLRIEAGDPISVSMVVTEVTETTLDYFTSSQQWPSHIAPGRFVWKYVFTNNPDLSLLTRTYAWRGEWLIDVGVQYFGDYTETDGFCHERTDDPQTGDGGNEETGDNGETGGNGEAGGTGDGNGNANPSFKTKTVGIPQACTALEACCDTFFQNHAYYETCMIDAYPDCCNDYGDGLFNEQKYDGYYGDDLTWFDSATKVGDEARVSAISKDDEGNHFSYKWWGWFCPDEIGTYKFQVTSDDASHFIIDGEMIIDNGGVHTTNKKSGFYSWDGSGSCLPFFVFYGEEIGAGSAIMRLKYNSPSMKKNTWEENFSAIFFSANMLIGFQEFWVDEGCHSEEDGMNDDVGGGFRPSYELYGVRCCEEDGSSCESSWNCASGTQLTYQQAQLYCANEGRRLCTRKELESDICCATGGGCDNYGIWTSSSTDPCISGPKGGYWIKIYQIQNGIDRMQTSFPLNTDAVGDITSPIGSQNAKLSDEKINSVASTLEGYSHVYKVVSSDVSDDIFIKTNANYIDTTYSFNVGEHALIGLGSDYDSINEWSLIKQGTHGIDLLYTNPIITGEQCSRFFFGHQVLDCYEGPANERCVSGGSECVDENSVGYKKLQDVAIYVYSSICDHEEVASSKCCNHVLSICPHDFQCSEGYCCSDIGTCVKCDVSRDCEGSWSQYTDCTASCGTGYKTRTYTVDVPADGGDECPFQDNEIYVASCNLDVCPSIIYCEDWPRNFYDGNKHISQNCKYWEAMDKNLNECQKENMVVCPYCGTCIEREDKSSECYGQWSDWGYCTSSLGEGTWTRYRQDVESCADEPFIEISNCNIMECV